MSKNIVCIIYFVLACSITQAQIPSDGSISYFSDAIGPKSISKFADGENIDLRTGSVYWEIPILKIPGDGGLDIEVKVSHAKGRKKLDSNAYNHLTNWELEIPRIKLSGASPFFEATESGYKPCTDWLLSIGYHDLNGNPQINYLGNGITLFIPNKSPITAFHNDGNGFPQEFTYVSAENWGVSCVNGGKDFMVYSPDGKIYKFEAKNSAGETANAMNLFYGIFNDPDTVVYVSEITDRFGNSVAYSYVMNEFILKTSDFFIDDDLGIRQMLVSNIEGSDGRTINFSYQTSNNITSSGMKSLSSMQYDDTIYTFEYDDIQRLKKIVPPSEAGFTSSPYEFSYTEALYGTPYFESWLTSASKLNGLSVSYEYEEKPTSYFSNLGSSAPINVLAERNVRGDLSGDKSQKFYYTIVSGNNITSVDDGRLTKYYFSRDRYLYGSLMKVEQYSSDGELLRVIENEWTATQRIGETLFFTENYVEDNFEYRKLLKSTLVDGKYLTEYKLYNQLGHPTKVTESGEKSKTTNFIYKKSNLTSDGFWVDAVIWEKDIENYGYGPNYTVLFDEKIMPRRTTENGLVTETIFNQSGNLTSKTISPDGNNPSTTVYSNYDLGAPKNIQNPDGSTLMSSYDRFGRQIETIDGRGFRRTFEYYKSGTEDNIKKYTSPRYNDTNYSYVFSNNKTEMFTNKSGYSEKTTFDGWLREVANEVYLEDRTLYEITEYDDLGRLSFKSKGTFDPSELWIGIRNHYDDLNRVTKTVNTADNTETNFYYEDQWNSIASAYNGPQIANGHAVLDSGTLKVYGYTSYGNPDVKELRSVSEFTGNLTTGNGGNNWITTDITRNKAGDILNISKGGFSHLMEYYADRPSLLKYKYEPGLNGKYLYEYDEKLQKTEEKFLRLNGDILSKKKYLYDLMGRVITILDGNGDIIATYTYDDNGNKLTSENSTSKIYYEYTSDNKIRKESLHLYEESLGDYYLVSDFFYTYDALENLAGIQVPFDNPPVQGPGYNYRLFNPNVLGQPTQVGEFASNIDYFPDGSVKSIEYANGARVDYEQNNRGFVTTIDVKRFGSIFKNDYEYDDVGNITSIQAFRELTGNFDTLNSYDGLGQLISTSFLPEWGDPEEEDRQFEYDDTNNITKKFIGDAIRTYSYSNAGNLLYSSSEGRSYSYLYDDFGNMTQYKSWLNIKYDQFDRVTSIDSLPGTQRIGINYAYDSDGRRLYKRSDVNRSPNIFADDVVNIYIHNNQDKLMASFNLKNLKSTNYYYISDKLISTNERTITRYRITSLARNAIMLDDELSVDPVKANDFFREVAQNKILAPLASDTNSFTLQWSEAGADADCSLFMCRVFDRFEYEVYSDEAQNNLVVADSTDEQYVSISDLPASGTYYSKVSAVFKTQCLLSIPLLCLGFSDFELEYTGQTKTIVELN